MEVPLPKNSLESAYRLVADIAELLLLHNVSLCQYSPAHPFVNPTPCKAMTQLSIESFSNPDGSAYQPDPHNAAVVPQDVIDRLCEAIQDLASIEESYWEQAQGD